MTTVTSYDVLHFCRDCVLSCPADEYSNPNVSTNVSTTHTRTHAARTHARTHARARDMYGNVNMLTIQMNVFLLQEMDMCQRCDKRVYPTEKTGPVRGAVFHKQCFKCVVCSQYLTMKTFNTNEVEATDREIYCTTHKPKIAHIDYGADAISIRRAMYAQGHLKVKKHYYMTFVVSDIMRE